MELNEAMQIIKKFSMAYADPSDFVELRDAALVLWEAYKAKCDGGGVNVKPPTLNLRGKPTQP